MYNRFAESGRVNWMMNVAAHVAPENKREFTELMSPRGIGLILASIRTDYKFVSSILLNSNLTQHSC